MSRAQGAAVLTIAALGTGAAVYAVSPSVLTIAVWVGGAWILFRAYRKSLQGAANPAPPPLPERGSEAEPQVTMMRDLNHPNRWIVTRETPWLRYRLDSRDETE